MAAASTVALVATIASTAVGAMGAYQQSQAAKAQAEFQAAQARNNAIIARQDADAIKARGDVAEQDHRRKVAQAVGAARAAQGGSGLLVEGEEDDTNVLLTADIAEAGELDILRIRDAVDLRVRNKLLQADLAENQGLLFQSKADSESPFLAAAGTLLTGAAKAAGIADEAGLFGSTSTA